METIPQYTTNLYSKTSQKRKQAPIITSEKCHYPVVNRSSGNYIWDKVFKSELSKFYGRQSLKNLLSSPLNTLSYLCVWFFSRFLRNNWLTSGILDSQWFSENQSVFCFAKYLAKLLPVLRFHKNILSWLLC